MNTKKLILSGLVALALSAVAAHAQPVLPGSDIGGLSNQNPGDLVLGFQNTTLAPNGDLVFDIGQFSSYEGVAAGTYTIAAFNATDLTNSFGTTALNGGFSTNTKWTVLGGSGNNGLTVPDNSIWVAASVVPSRAAAGTQSTISGNADGLVNSLFGGAGLTSPDAANLANKAFTNLGPATGYSGTYSGVESSTAGTTSLGLYELQPGSGNGALLGTFTLSQSTGLLTFTVLSSIPEPSTYAALLGVVTLSIVAIRRRQQASSSIEV